MTSVNDSLMYQGNCNVPTWGRDSGGNITGLVGPDGEMYLGRPGPVPSGDATGQTDRAAIQAAIDAGTGIVHLSGSYVVDSDILMAADVHLVLAPETTITLRDSFTATATLDTGSTTVPVSSTSGIKVGMHVADNAAVYGAASPFGAIQFGTTVATVGTNSITLSQVPASSGAATLRFLNNCNVIKATNVDDWSITCPVGWAYIDGNMDHQYPYDDNSLDANRNGIRVASCSGWHLDGIECKNSAYHGLIGIGRMSGISIGRYRGVSNGWRGIHLHGEAVLGDTTPEITGIDAQYIEVDGNGVIAFRTRQGNEVSSGVFMVFENVKRVHLNTVVAKNERGNGFAANGASGAFLAAGDYSRHITVDSVIAHSCMNGLALYNGFRQANFGSVQVTGDHALISGCATLDAANTNKYYVDVGGTVRTIVTRRVQLPANSIATYGIREGFVVYATDGTGFVSTMATVWDVSEGTGAGGTDIITVFNHADESAAPYTTVVASNVYLQIFSAGKYGLYLGASVAAGRIEDIHIGSLICEGIGHSGIYSNYSSSEYRYSAKIDKASIGYIGITALNGGSWNGLYIGSLAISNVSNYKIDATAGSASGSYDAILYNCVNCEIRDFSHKQTAAWADNNERIRLDDKCRNIHIWPISLTPTTGAGNDIMNILTTAGAGDNGNGYSGPVIIHEPRYSTGGLIPINTTATVNQITRTNANACYRVVYSDTP